MRYRPICAIALAPWEVEDVIDAAVSGGQVTAGHGAYRISVAPLRGERVSLSLDEPGCRVNAKVSIGDLAGLRGERRILLAAGDKLGIAEIRGHRYYKLVPTIPGSAPTLEIDGIHMHRVRGSDPLRDTRYKVAEARIRVGVEVLDTCMGLGYTAIASVLRGARRVITVEIDRNVIELSRVNPWSWRLSDNRISVVHSDVTEYVRSLESESFDRVIHDPPRITSRSGPLYSLDFYKELYRIMKPRGVLFHYTGEPGRKHGANFPGRIASKLKRAGFRVVRYSRRALGLVAVKD
ncbi:MAG: RsmD family RNA methyltransferase [Desulfurococcales archaeon]|nr:RsmD family RNA methyltransferase [Desulfurococcales archaeon]